MHYSTYRWMMTAPGAPLEKVGCDPLIPGRGEAIVEVAGCGVCHTDLGYYYDGVRTKHELPLALGHEVSGRVVATGEGAETWSGKAVLVPSVIHCGTCDLCRGGHSTSCRAQKMPGNDLHGGFASHIAVPVHGLCEIDEARLEAAGLDLADISVVADAVTTPYQAARRSGLAEGDLTIVVGIGGVGGYAVQIARALGARVVAIDIDAAKLDIISGFGADLTLNAGDLDSREMKKAIFAFARENGLRSTGWIVMECSGTTAGQQTAFGLLSFSGTLCVIGFTRDEAKFRLSNLMAYDARAIGNWGCATELYPEAVDLVLDGKVQLLPFVERRPLDQINEVFAAVHDGSVSRRIILVPDMVPGKEDIAA